MHAYTLTHTQTLVRVDPKFASMPLHLTSGWNSVVVDLAALVRRIWNCEYKHCSRLNLCANTRIRRIYFCDRLYKEAELPSALKLFPEDVLAD
jgi:hypothetical protein